MAFALSLWALATLALSPCAEASRAKVGEFGTPAGGGNGKLSGPRGVAVNLSGAGGVAAGEVYVADTNNNRVEEFDGAGNFVRAWGADVVASGPDDKGTGFEVCLAADVCKAGSESAIAGGLNHPIGAAIDQANGNVYVVDASENLGFSNGRVAVYSAKGAFEGAFGWSVDASDPKEELQFCTIASGCQKGTFGEGTGQLSLPPHSLPAVGSDGRFYFPDSGRGGVPGNLRVDVFTPALNGAKEVTGVDFTEAFGWDVVASGPDQSSETQRIFIHATGGNFKLTATTAKGSGTLTSGSKEVSGVSTTSGTFHTGDAIAGVGIPNNTTIAAVGAGSLELSAAATASGAHPLTATERTAEIAWNAVPGEVQKALTDLPGIGAGAVEVSGGPGDSAGTTPYEVRFTGALAHADVTQLLIAKGVLSGPSVGDTAVETYANGTEGLERCVPARGDACKAGTRGGHMGQFDAENPTSVAVNSAGTVYAVNQSTTPTQDCEKDPADAPCRVYAFKFPAAGEVTAEEFAPAQLSHESGEAAAVYPTDVSVDPANDHVLVARKEGKEAFKFFEFDGNGNLLEESPAGLPLKANANPLNHGLAIGTERRFYFTNPKGMVDIFGPPPPPTVKIGAVTGVGSSSATVSGTVTPAVGVEGEHFATSYHFEVSRNGISWARFPAEDLELGDGSGAGAPSTCPTNDPPVCEVLQTIPGLQPNADYLVRLVATNGSEAISEELPFTTKAAPPTVSLTLATAITKTTAKLTSLVNPNNEPTTYHFEWGESTAYGNEVPAFEAFAGSGGEGLKAIAPISGLKEAAAYHFRVVATNAAGTTTGPDQLFTTLDSFGLPEGRAPEQVSPNDKRPVGLVGWLGLYQINYQTAADGNSILYPLLNGLPDSTAGGNVIYRAQRDPMPEGWLSEQITPPSLIPPPVDGVLGAATGRVLYASADLTCQIVQSFEPLSADTPTQDIEEGIVNLYRRNEDGTYTLLSTPVPLGTALKSIPFPYHVDAASSDCSHVLFDSRYRLLSGAPITNAGLYESAPGTLRLAGVLPDESVADGAVAGGSTNLNSLSADGSRLFFSATSNEGADSGKTAVFVTEGGETIDVSQSKTATPNNDDASYQLASSDGSRVFFLARYGLAGNGSSSGLSACAAVGGEGCDLYSYAVGSEVLTDLSADSNPADLKGAGAVGLLDASDDGTYAYFATRGQLLPNQGKTEAQNFLGAGSYNVYLSHAGVLSFAGRIAQSDALGAGSGGDLAADSGHWAADATPDGKHLAFISKANVTGYESLNNGNAVAQAYLYSTDSGETVCVSCRGDGQAPLGDPEDEPLATMLQSETRNGSVSVIQNRPRAISNDGSRVFFKSADVLAAGAIPGGRNFYEWSDGQVYLLLASGGGEGDFSEYVDTSADGNDAFLVTQDALSPADFDNTRDLYDMRAPHLAGEVVGQTPPPPPPPACDPLAGACQAPMPTPGGEGVPGPSEGPPGPGNPPVPKPKPNHHSKGKGKKGKGKKHKAQHNGKGRTGR